MVDHEFRMLACQTDQMYQVKRLACWLKKTSDESRGAIGQQFSQTGVIAPRQRFQITIHGSVSASLTELAYQHPLAIAWERGEHLLQLSVTTNQRCQIERECPYTTRGSESARVI
jgi:hypothetical protein